MDLNYEILELLNSIFNGTEPPGHLTFENLVSHQSKIHEIAGFCRTTELYQRSNSQEKELKDDFSKNMTAVECFQQMILKINEAPIQLLATSAVILIMPIISDKMNGDM